MPASVAGGIDRVVRDTGAQCTAPKLADSLSAADESEGARLGNVASSVVAARTWPGEAYPTDGMRGFAMGIWVGDSERCSATMGAGLDVNRGGDEESNGGPSSSLAASSDGGGDGRPPSRSVAKSLERSERGTFFVVLGGEADRFDCRLARPSAKPAAAAAEDTDMAATKSFCLRSTGGTMAVGSRG